MKITPRAKAEFEFYRDTPLDMIGRTPCQEAVSDPQGYSALECWWAKDTHGKTLPCREPDLLEKVTRSKQSVNLQVKMWAEDIADGLILQYAELVEYTRGWPEWVVRAVMHQAGKIAMSQHGFVPRFCQIP